MSYAPLSTTDDTTYSPPFTPPRASHPRLARDVHSPTTSFTPSRGKVDLRSIEEGFSRWIDAVRDKGKRRKGKGNKGKTVKPGEDGREVELYESVFVDEVSHSGRPWGR